LQPRAGTARDAVGGDSVAADVMNQEVITVTETTSVQETIERMMATGRKVLPVVDTQGHLVGVVGRSDLLRVLLEG
jgi:CBS domain-containing protein